VQNYFRGCTPRVRRTTALRGYDFALQVRIRGPRVLMQLYKFQRFLDQKYEAARLLITLEGVISDGQPLEINLLVQAAITGDSP
jgi:hypothetical protein